MGGASFGGNSHACLWRGTSASFVDLNPTGATKSVAKAVSGGWQAGYVYVGGKFRACVWTGTAGSWVDLNALLPSGSYIDSYAQGIYVSGADTWVVGSATKAADQWPVAVMWHYVAVPEPSSLLALLTGVGGLGGLVWRRRR